MKKYFFLSLWIAILILIIIAFWRLFPVKSDSRSTLMETAEFYREEVIVTEPIQPIPREMKLDKRKVNLGEKLFMDPRLSRNNTISCSSCHKLNQGGTDGQAKSMGIEGQLGDVNTPTVFNAVFNFKQFWDGRVDSLEDQIDGPIHNLKEMGTNWEEVSEKLAIDSEYSQAFGKIYKDGMTPENIRNAIAAFESSLITPNSRFDQYLTGNQDALSEKELKGYRYFKDLGCIVCHQGVNVGGNMFQTFGKFGDYFADRGNITKADLGRFNVTGKERDMHKFKVPSLRNVEKTAPYFHDGTAKTLEDAVKTMGYYQLGHDLSEEEVSSIVAFLNTLTGEYAGEPV